ncbi:gamma-glutamyltransferase 6 [Silurus asotus]|uniref:Gamma-glutamyltransferase 6 n=1 Tax=Silurus asotus TaxID=30991 RepID=A0AAD5AAK6_SILAS|nr:gamma-glutamyltransferase 6 [Silurus asotus]
MVVVDVQYTKVATENQDEIEAEREHEDSDEEQVTVYFKQSKDRLQGTTGKRLTCFRVSVALVLLGIVSVFALLQWYDWWPDPEGFYNAERNTKNISKEQEEHHHDTAIDDDDDDDHKNGEEPHHHVHTALFHHAVVLTASAKCSSIGGIFSAVLYNSTSGSLKTIHSVAHQMSSTTFGIPSILQGIKELHSHWGQCEWRQLFKEAVTLARDGFLIDDVLGRALESHKEEILLSQLCDLFCDAPGRMKSVGAMVQNPNLSELLQRASQNENNFLETVAVKLSEDLSPSERPAFLAAIQHSRGEINDSLIIEGEKYSVLSAALPYAAQMLSDILERVRQQSLSFHNGADFNITLASYSALLPLIQERNNSSLDEKYPGLLDTYSLDTQNSHIAVLDKYGNYVIMSASLNSTWGSGRFLPSSGILLNSFTRNISNSPYLNIPLLLRLTEDDDSHDDNTEVNEEQNEVEVLAITGGLSALFNAALLLHCRIDLGMSSKEAISSPLVHLEPGTSSAFCLSATLNDSDFYMMFSDGRPEFQQVDECSDHSSAMLLRLHADHSIFGCVPHLRQSIKPLIARTLMETGVIEQEKTYEPS